MDKININNLFSSDVPQTSKNESINVRTIINPDSNKKDEIGIERLRNLRYERRKKITSEYEKIFKTCVKDIHIANDEDMTDTIFTLPDPITYYTDPYYKNDECQDYIYNKLIDNHLKAEKRGNSKIYISWKEV